MTTEYALVVLLFVLFVVPRVLQRYRVPAAVTALGCGLLPSPWMGLLQHDTTVALLYTLGIVSCFLFAGLDVNPRELVDERRTLLEHVLVRVLMIALVSALGVAVLGLERPAAVLVALSLLTPSTGFILDSVGRWLAHPRDRFWVRSKAIATELVALFLLFVVMQSSSPVRLAASAAVLIAMVAVLPVVFRWFASAVLPHAPRSEFGFLLMVALVCAVVTRQLGVYYLVGAFAAGLVARRFRAQLPALASDRMLDAVEAFASLFVPFYFFHAGLSLGSEIFTLAAAGYGAVFLITVVPFRLCVVAAHRAWRLREAPAQGLRIAMAMLPTTVFALVLVEILREQAWAPRELLGGLVIYALGTTRLPGLVLRADVAAFEEELTLGSATS